jgi:acyl-CoA reductase-like NAD-dependent aldehyde dehydrogenase
VCVSTQRIFVHSTLMPAFLDRFVARVRALRTGDPLLPETEVGPLINPGEVDRVETWVSEAAAGGAKVAAGGKRRSATIMEPTVLVEPAPDARVSRDEIFGPVCCVYGFDQLDEAIDRANSLPVAFQASVFASDIDAALHAADRLDASAVMINDHTAFRTDWMPFAGRRESGYGVGGIPYSMREMTQEKMRVFRYRM